MPSRVLQGHLWARFWGCWGGSWCPIWCLCGLEGAPRISKTFYFGPLEPPRLRKNNFSSKTTHYQKSRFYHSKIAVFVGEGTKIKTFKKLLNLDTFFWTPFSGYIYGFLLDLFRRRLPKRCFPCLGASRCRFRAPKRTLTPSKTFILRR